MNSLLALVSKCDALGIPQDMSLPYTIIWTISLFALFPLFSTLAIVFENSKSLHSDNPTPNIRKVLGIIILALLGLVLYRHIVIKTIAVCDAIEMSLVDKVSIYDTTQYVYKQADQQFENMLNSAGVDLSKNASIVDKVAIKAITPLARIANHLRPQVFVLGVISFLVMIVEPILIVIRYGLLSLLFVLGPIAIVFAIVPMGRSFLKGWYSNLLQISFWLVILRIFQLVFLALDVKSLAAADDGVAIIVLGAIYVGFFLMIPMISAKILSGQNIGTVASIAATAAAGALTSAHQLGTTQAIAGGFSSIKESVGSAFRRGGGTPAAGGPNEAPPSGPASYSTNDTPSSTDSDAPRRR